MGALGISVADCTESSSGSVCVVLHDLSKDFVAINIVNHSLFDDVNTSLRNGIQSCERRFSPSIGFFRARSGIFTVGWDFGI